MNLRVTWRSIVLRVPISVIARRIWEVAINQHIDRTNFAIGALLALAIALLCSQTLVAMRVRPGTVERVMTLIVPLPHQSASLRDPDSGSKPGADASPQSDGGLCFGKAPDCGDEDGDNSSGDEDDNSYDPPDPTDPVPA